MDTYRTPTTESRRRDIWRGARAVAAALGPPAAGPVIRHDDGPVSTRASRPAARTLLHGDHFAVPRQHVLHPYVQGIWRTSSASRGHGERIMPRGVVDLLFPLAGTVVITASGQTDPPVLAARPFIAGVQARVLTTLTAEPSTLLGVSVRAEWARAILPLPAHEIASTVVEGVLVLDDAADVFGRLHDATSFHAQCAILLEWLTARLRSSARLKSMYWAYQALSQRPTDAGVQSIVETLALSSRQVRRLFLDHVGMTPHQYARLRRFNRALTLMSSGQNLTDIAHQSGYYDQAHFCHDFQHLAGMAPSDYRLQAGPVPGLIFFEDVRIIQAPR